MFKRTTDLTAFHASVAALDVKHAVIVGDIDELKLDI